MKSEQVEIKNRLLTNSSGLELHYAEAGSAELPALVLLNGFGMSTEEWTSQLFHFSDRFRVIALDRRGHGRSQFAPLRSFDDSLADLHDLVTHLGLEKITIAGVSMGGTEAMAYALAHPGKVRSLILIDTFASVPPAVQEQRVETLRTALDEQSLEEYASFLVDHIITAPGSSMSRSALENRFSSLGKETMFNTLSSLYRVDYEPLLSQLTLPVLVVVGDADVRTTPEAVEALAHKIPGAQFNLIPGAGHFPHLDQPERLNTVIDQFFAKLA